MLPNRNKNEAEQANQQRSNVYTGRGRLEDLGAYLCRGDEPAHRDLQLPQDSHMGPGGPLQPGGCRVPQFLRQFNLARDAGQSGWSDNNSVAGMNCMEAIGRGGTLLLSLSDLSSETIHRGEASPIPDSSQDWAAMASIWTSWS